MTTTMNDRPPPPDAAGRGVQRLRQPPKARLVEVRRVRHITPHLCCITFTGEDLHDFASTGFDDHLKLLLPTPGVPFELPNFGPGNPPADGPPPGPRPNARDYTPRRFDVAARELDIEFALHGEGPADDFARLAEVGQRVGIAGPRGSFIVPMDFDWHLLIGDDTALPAIARRLEELPADAAVTVIIEVDHPDDRPPLPSRARTVFTWLYRAARDGRLVDAAAARSLAQATAALMLPGGAGYAWAAGEASEIAAVRRELVGTLGLDKRSVRAAAYWKRGAAGHHSKIED